MQSFCRPGTNEQHEPSCRTSEERYRENAWHRVRPSPGCKLIAIQYERPRRSKRIFRMVCLIEYKSNELPYAAVLEDAGSDGPAYLDLPPSHWKRLNRSIVYTLSATSASSSLQRLATITL